MRRCAARIIVNYLLLVQFNWSLIVSQCKRKIDLTFYNVYYYYTYYKFGCNNQSLHPIGCLTMEKRSIKNYTNIWNKYEICVIIILLCGCNWNQRYLYTGCFMRKVGCVLIPPISRFTRMTSMVEVPFKRKGLKWWRK